jgi:hypothetical protein
MKNNSLYQETALKNENQKRIKKAEKSRIAQGTRRRRKRLWQE